jgi:hypothetical protein
MRKLTEEERFKKIMSDVKDRAEQIAKEEYEREYWKMWHHEYPYNQGRIRIVD